MLKSTIYIAIALFVVLVFVRFTNRSILKKRKQALMRLKLENQRYIELEMEMETIKRKRMEIETEHPYQKLLTDKLKLKNAESSGDVTIVAKLEDSIRLILDKHDATEEKLVAAFRAQMDAMNRRLSEIELAQRQMELEAKRLSNIFKGKSS